MNKIWPGIVNALDGYSSSIKEDLYQHQKAIDENKPLKKYYQERLQNLDKEIEELKNSTTQKINFLKIKLDKEFELQYAYRQKNFSQIIQRIHRQQRKNLQIRCVEQILAKIQSEIKKKSDFCNEYMLKVLETNEERTKLKL